MKHRMKTILIYTIAWMCVGGVRANDIMVRLTSGGRTRETVVVTTNEHSFGGVNWEASDGGGSENLLVVRDKDRVIVTKRILVTTGMTNSLTTWIEHETTSKTSVPIDRLPYTLVDSATTITVFRAEQKISGEPDSRVKKLPNRATVLTE